MWGYSLVRSAYLTELGAEAGRARVLERQLDELQRRASAAMDASARNLTAQVAALVTARDKAELDRDALARELADLRSAYAAQALAAMTPKAPERPATIDRNILTAIDGRYPKHAKLARQRLLQWAGQQAREGIEPAVIAAQIADGIADDALEMQAEEV